MDTKYTTLPWTVYRCEFDKWETDRACGFNGESLDASYDECHHVLSAADAAFIVRAVNAHNALMYALNTAIVALSSLCDGIAQHHGTHSCESAALYGLASRRMDDLDRARAALKLARGGE